MAPDHDASSAISSNSEDNHLSCLHGLDGREKLLRSISTCHLAGHRCSRGGKRLGRNVVGSDSPTTALLGTARGNPTAFLSGYVAPPIVHLGCVSSPRPIKMKVQAGITC